MALQRLIQTTLLCAFFLLLYIPSLSQTIHWKDNPDETYVFEINNKEAEKLIKSNPADSLILKMLHTPRGSFSKEWRDAPKQGHFIFAQIKKNRVSYEYVPIMPFQVFLFKEYGVLTLQVIDSEGTIRKDAKVRIKGKWRWNDIGVYFDKESQTYTINDDSEKTERLLTVELNKFKAVFDLEKHLVYPWYNNHDRPGSPAEFYSYMITDKNKYKPGETVRFKSYALSHRRKPIKEDLEVWIRNANYNFKKVTTVAAHHPGGFAGEVFLHDSLGLQLDKSYLMQLRNQKGRIVASVSFQYEDYELYDNKLDVKLGTHYHYYAEANQLEIKVTDANGLLLPDVKADIVIRRSSVQNSYTDILILPDTLLHERINLDNEQPTRFDIPATLFGESDCSYTIHVEVLTVDNQRMIYNNSVIFFRSHYGLATGTRNDTIRFEFRELGKEKVVDAILSYNGSKEEKKITLPYEEPFNQATQSYYIKVPDINYEIRIYPENLYAGLDLAGGIQKDSFNVKLINPLGLNVSYYIYQGNILLQKGSGKEFDFKYPNTDLETTHYVEIFYFMGDDEQVYRRVFVPKSEYLSVDVDLPGRVYPGQTLDASITVKDYLGKPVKGADITAFATNSLLNYHVQDLPYYGMPPRTRKQRSSYSIEKRYYSLSAPLDYNFWNKKAKLDKMDYYRFTYPRKGIFIHTVNVPDSTTQFAPFIMKDGNAVDIYVIEVDGSPVYFSWTTHPQAYSFPASDSSKHQISLRLHDRVITMDSMRFEKGKKTIFSFDLDHLPPNVRQQRLDKKDHRWRHIFTDKESDFYKKCIARIPVNRNGYVYLKQDDNIYPVFIPCISPYTGSVLIGPVPQARTWFRDEIEYRHEGGYSYHFDENVVYKFPADVLPEYLQFSSTNIFDLNQFYLSPRMMDTLVRDCYNKRSIWHPRSIQVAQEKMQMNFRLPVEKDGTGVANLLFRDRITDKVILPDVLESGISKYVSVSPGIYDIFLLYNNGKYLKVDSIPLRNYTFTEINMAKQMLHEPDSFSNEWVSKTIKKRLYGFEDLYSLNDDPRTVSTSNMILPNRRTIVYTQGVINRRNSNTVTGYVFDSTGEPLIGVSVIVKNTTKGTITDIDGRFEIEIDYAISTLVFSYIGYKQKEIEVTHGSELKVVLEEEQMLLEEVVVIGYGTQKRSNLTGSVSSVSYEAEPLSPPEDVEDSSSEQKETEDAEDRLYSELMQLNGLRSNFSDVAFWEPRLFTDKKGKARFNVTFPDNITQWEAVVYAMNKKLRTGTARKSIKSYKPLMAELKTPQFLVAGDSSYVSGNIRNYTKDKEIKGNLMFISGNDTLKSNPVDFTSSYADYTLITGSNTDSITNTYLFTRDDGYTDGEKRTIPIEPQGTEIAEGLLQILRNGDKLNVTADQGEEVKVSLTARQLDVYVNATYDLTGYKYACNEQLASKLIGLLSYRFYQQYLNKEFKHDRNINQIIKRLVDNRNENKLWSWWGNSPNTTFWMSAHILRALKMAKDVGYTVNLDMRKIEQDYMDTNRYRGMNLSDVEILHALSEWKTEQNYEAAVKMFEERIHIQEAYEDSIAAAKKTTRSYSYLKEKLLLWEIRQQQNINFEPDSIKHYLKKDAVGAVYCDDGIQRSWYSDNLATTLIAYRIISKDSALRDLKEPMQMYILGTKNTGWNTYRSASVVSTVLPDLLAESVNVEKTATVHVSGKENKEVTSFPYNVQLAPGENLSLHKEDGIPLLYSSSTVKRVTQAQSGDAFEVSTTLSSGDTLIAGEPVRLTVELKVKQKNAEYVMIEVPIPAGCSYASKSNSYGREVHREHFKEKTVIFCEKLPEDTYKFYIQLLPRYSGKYTMNPAKAELMYFPTVNANNDLRKVSISENTKR